MPRLGAACRRYLRGRSSLALCLLARALARLDPANGERKLRVRAAASLGRASSREAFRLNTRENERFVNTQNMEWKAVRATLGL